MESEYMTQGHMFISMFYIVEKPSLMTAFKLND